VFISDCKTLFKKIFIYLSNYWLIACLVLLFVDCHLVYRYTLFLYPPVFHFLQAIKALVGYLFAFTHGRCLHACFDLLITFVFCLYYHLFCYPICTKDNVDWHFSFQLFCNIFMYTRLACMKPLLLFPCFSFIFTLPCMYLLFWYCIY